MRRNRLGNGASAKSSAKIASAQKDSRNVHPALNGIALSRLTHARLIAPTSRDEISTGFRESALREENLRLRERGAARRRASCSKRTAEFRVVPDASSGYPSRATKPGHIPREYQSCLKISRPPLGTRSRRLCRFPSSRSRSRGSPARESRPLRNFANYSGLIPICSQESTAHVIRPIDPRTDGRTIDRSLGRSIRKTRVENGDPRAAGLSIARC